MATAAEVINSLRDQTQSFGCVRVSQDTGLVVVFVASNCGRVWGKAYMREGSDIPAPHLTWSLPARHQANPPDIMATAPSPSARCPNNNTAATPIDNAGECIKAAIAQIGEDDTTPSRSIFHDPAAHPFDFPFGRFGDDCQCNNCSARRAAAEELGAEDAA